MSTEEIPYMLENTPEEFRRVRDLAWPAPDLSPAEAARVAEFDAAPEPPEIVVERVAVAMYDEAMRRAITAAGVGIYPDQFRWPSVPAVTRDWYRAVATAAIAEMEPVR